MSRSRESSPDDEHEENAEFFSDSSSSIAEALPRDADTDDDADDELAAATERLRLYNEEDGDALEESPNRGFQESNLDTESREVTPSLRSSESEEIEAGEAEIFSGGNGSERSDQSAGSEVNITAIEEELDPAPHKGLIDKSEKAPHELPTGKFWMHDDRTEDDANNRRITRPRKLWDQTDNKEWKHDLFDLDPEQDEYMGFIERPRRGGRGRGRGRNEGAYFNGNGRERTIGASYGYASSTRKEDFGKQFRGNGYKGGHGERRPLGDNNYQAKDQGQGQYGRSLAESGRRGSSHSSRNAEELYTQPPPGYEHVAKAAKPKSSNFPESSRASSATARVDTNPQETAWPSLPSTGRNDAQQQAKPVWVHQDNYHTQEANVDSAEDGWPNNSSHPGDWGAIDGADDSRPDRLIDQGESNKVTPWGAPVVEDTGEVPWGASTPAASADSGWGEASAAAPADAGWGAPAPTASAGKDWAALPSARASDSGWGPGPQPASQSGEKNSRAGDLEHRAETSNGRADIWGANDEASAWGGASVSQATEGLPEENKQTAADWGASGEKLTPWGAPIPEAEPETDWGRPVAADAGWGESPVKEEANIARQKSWMPQMPSTAVRGWNIDAQEWKGSSALAAQLASSLNVAAPQFIPPSSIQGLQMHKPAQASYTPYPVLANGLMSMATNNSQGSIPPDYLAGPIPGPMHVPQEFNGLARPRPARRPITIEAPPDFTGQTLNFSEATGGRRYSAMSQYPN